jgi:hypothetical protein
MGLNIAEGKMYGFVTHTWNTVRGVCPHRCSYCYMKQFPSGLDNLWFANSELKTNLGSGNSIFVGSANDLFTGSIPEEWIRQTIDHCARFDNRYFFQSKNPKRFKEFEFPEQKNLFSELYPSEKKYRFCTTIETNRIYKNIMGETPTPQERSESMIKGEFITIEPIMDFDITEMVELIKTCEPEQVNIGADSKFNGLPEPRKGKVLELIDHLEAFTKVNRKETIYRILNN